MYQFIVNKTTIETTKGGIISLSFSSTDFMLQSQSLFLKKRKKVGFLSDLFIFFAVEEDLGARKILQFS